MPNLQSHNRWGTRLIMCPKLLMLHHYVLMFRSKGWRLALYYFINCQMFDILRRTDTHLMVEKEHFRDRPHNYGNAVLYMASWTSQIVKIFNTLESQGYFSEPHTFIDIGSGKGKVPLLWSELCSKHQVATTKIIGLDFCQSFISTSIENMRKVKGRDIEFICEEATRFDYRNLSTPLVVYLFNPFDEIVLRRVTQTLPRASLVIYTNPVHQSLLLNQGYQSIWEQRGWHPNQHSVILIKGSR